MTPGIKGNGMNREYEKYLDEELVLLAQGEDGEAFEVLIKRYKEMVKGQAYRYYIAGSDREDIIQEGMLGIFKAVLGYDQAKEASFHTFADLCVKRQIIDAVRRATRRKHDPLNESLSLDKLVEEGESYTYQDIIGDKTFNLEDTVILNDEIDLVAKKGKEIFSYLEWTVLMEYLRGESYREIAASMGRSPKAIDNAIQRMKHKLSQHFNRS